MSTSYDEGHCSWIDFEPEPDTTGDGSGDPDKYILTIRDQRGEELATIVHRLCGGKFPLDGRLANGKRHNAQVIVDALNDNQHGETHAERLWQTPAEVSVDTNDPGVVGALAELVHDVASEIASAVNNAGGGEQVDFLLSNGWTMPELVERVKNATHGD